MGKPVLAEVADAEETGFEYTVFAIPLETADTEQDKVIVQIGGDKARLLGHKGGLTIRDGDVLSCEYLWAIQLSNMEGIRFIKVDGQGERSEEHTSELQSLMRISYAVFCLKKKNKVNIHNMRQYTNTKQYK